MTRPRQNGHFAMHPLHRSLTASRHPANFQTRHGKADGLTGEHMRTARALRRPPRTAAAAVLTLAGLGVALALSMLPGTAEATHVGQRWSLAGENSAGTVYDGVRVTRGDNNPTGPLNGCSTAFEGGSDPVYQTQWVRFNDGWTEGGTGHQCNSQVQFWFSGYAINGEWNARQIVYIDSGSSTLRSRALYRNANHEWRYEVAGAALHGASFVTWYREGYAVEAGLETYSPDSAVGKHAYGALHSYNNGTWSPWAGRDYASDRYGDWGLCGLWSSTVGNDNYWYAAQNRSC